MPERIAATSSFASFVPRKVDANSVGVRSLNWVTPWTADPRSCAWRSAARIMFRAKISRRSAYFAASAYASRFSGNVSRKDSNAGRCSSTWRADSVSPVASPFDSMSLSTS